MSECMLHDAALSGAGVITPAPPASLEQRPGPHSERLMARGAGARGRATIISTVSSSLGDVLTSVLLGISAAPGACELVRPPTSAIGAVVAQ